MLKLVVLLGLALVGCAIAIGEKSIANVNTKADTKREVTEDTATIEDVLMNKDKK